MNGTRRGGYTATLAALLVAGAVAFSGAALADSYDDGGDGSSQRGSDGKDGTATTHCKQKFSTDVHAPIQCYPSTAKHGKDDGNATDDDSDGANGANGTSTSNGAGPHNGKSDYKNPVTGETHFIPLPNIG
jgi:hypothetical protein